MDKQKEKPCVVAELDRELVLNLINKKFRNIESHLLDKHLFDKDDLIEVLLNTASDCVKISEQIKKIKV